MHLKDRSVLITGGAGFIGSNLAEYLSDENRVVVLDDLSLGRAENIGNPNIELLRGSILDDDILDSLGGIDIVFHLAAIPGVQDSIEKPIETSEINFIGTLKILEAMRKRGIPRIVFASSCAVYGEPLKLPVSEETPLHPLSPYAVQKIASEHIIRTYGELYGIKGISMRFFNVFGPRQNPDSEYSAVIPRFISRCLKGNSPIIYGTGEQTRDFIYVRDLIRALELAAIKMPGISEINAGSGQETSIKDLALLVIEETKCGLRPEYRNARKGEISRSFADISLAKKKLGWSPEYSLERGIEETVDYIKKRT